MTDNKFHTGQIIKNLQRVKSNLPLTLGNQAVGYFRKSFDNGGLEGEPKWKEVKRRIPGTDEYKYPLKTNLSRQTRNILQGQSGVLARATSASLRKADWTIVSLVVPVRYAAIQNEGGTIHKEEREAVLHFRRKKNGQTVFAKEKKAHFGQKATIGEHDIVIDARPFMGHTKKLQSMQQGEITKEIDNTFKV